MKKTPTLALLAAQLADNCRFMRFAIPAMILSTMATLSGQALQPSFDQVQLGTIDATGDDRSRAWGVAVADFNNDTIPDVVSGDTYGDVHLYLGNGNGTFTNAGVKINQSYHDAYSLAAGDFNGDGKADFVLARTGGDQTGLAPYASEGEIHLYLGNGNGTFQSSGSPQLGILIGNAGVDCFTLAAGDVDGDGDLDLISGDRISGTGDTADIRLWRNRMVPDGMLTFAMETVDSAGSTLDQSNPPYYPPNSYLHSYGLALGDLTGDGLPELLISDKAHYLYIYRNTEGGVFTPIFYNNITTRPYAYKQLDSLFNECMPLAVADVNDDGLRDVVTGYAGVGEGAVSLWVNEGLDSSDRPQFTGAGFIGSAGTDVRGLATGQLNPNVDAVPDVLFGNYEGNLYGLFPDLVDSDHDGIIDDIDNAPLIANAPRIDMNTDGGINHRDQLDNDNDGVGDPADTDDDNDGVPDASDNAKFTANADQLDSDGDGIGNVEDPLNNADSDGDGITNGPLDPALYQRAKEAKGRWARDDTHFIIRIDALGRLFQNEFTQVLTDAAILTPGDWETKKLES